MFRIVRRSVFAGALAMGLVMAALGSAPAAAAPSYARVKLVFSCKSVGPVTVTVQGPGVAASARDDIGTYYFRGRPGVYKIKRLSNGRIAAKSKSVKIKKTSTRTIKVCSKKW
jgi:hypothetical protein